MTSEEIIEIIYKSVEILNKVKGSNFEISEVEYIETDSPKASVRYKLPNGISKTWHWTYRWLDDPTWDGGTYIDFTIPEKATPKEIAIMKIMSYLWKNRGRTS